MQMLAHPGGAALEQWRLALGLSREGLGAAAGGVSSSTIRRIERGEVRPHPSTLAALLGALEQRSAVSAHNDHDPAADRAAGKAGNGNAHPAE